MDVYTPFYSNLEEYANEGEENYLLARKILPRLSLCPMSEVTDTRFRSKNPDRPYKCICGVSIAETFPFKIIGKERKEKTLFVGSKCIERVMDDQIPTSLDFEQSLFNRCCFEKCNQLLKKRPAKNKIILHFCQQHRKGFHKYKCSGCPFWCEWNSGRPTHAFCPTCVKRFKKIQSKSFCCYCNEKLKNTSFKQCYSCFKKTFKKCIKCNKNFDSQMGKFEKCLRCHFNMPTP